MDAHKTAGHEDAARARRILVVDDDEAIRYLVTETLRDAGYDCLPVEDGSAALSIIDSWVPDGVLLDLMMPKVDGPQVVALLRSACRRSGLPMPRIMIMTAGFAARKVAQDLSIKHWLGKPFMLRELLDKTASLLEDAPPLMDVP